MRKGDQFRCHLWRGSYTVIDYLVNLQEGYLHTKGLFHPAKQEAAGAAQPQRD